MFPYTLQLPHRVLWSRIAGNIGHPVPGRKILELRLEKNSTPPHQPFPEETPHSILPRNCQGQRMRFFVLNEALPMTPSLVVKASRFPRKPAGRYGWATRQAPCPYSGDAEPLFLARLRQIQSFLASRRRG